MTTMRTMTFNDFQWLLMSEKCDYIENKDKLFLYNWIHIEAISFQCLLTNILEFGDKIGFSWMIILLTK
jgi:hypothetical protein